MNEPKLPSTVEGLLRDAEAWLTPVRERQDPQTKLIRELAYVLSDHVLMLGIVEAALADCKTIRQSNLQAAQRFEAQLAATREALVAALDEHEATRVLTLRVSELKDQLRAVSPFVHHQDDCDKVFHADDPDAATVYTCTCGLDAALKGELLR